VKCKSNTVQVKCIFVLMPLCICSFVVEIVNEDIPRSGVLVIKYVSKRSEVLIPQQLHNFFWKSAIQRWWTPSASEYINILISKDRKCSAPYNASYYWRLLLLKRSCGKSGIWSNYVFFRKCLL